MQQLSNNLGFYPLEPETIVESIVFKKSSLGNSAHILVLTEKRIILQNLLKYTLGKIFYQVMVIWIRF